jgi:hypothetical protein
LERSSSLGGSRRRRGDESCLLGARTADRSALLGARTADQSGLLGARTAVRSGLLGANTDESSPGVRSNMVENLGEHILKIQLGLHLEKTDMNDFFHWLSEIVQPGETSTFSTGPQLHTEIENDLDRFFQVLIHVAVFDRENLLVIVEQLVYSLVRCKSVSTLHLVSSSSCQPASRGRIGILSLGTSIVAAAVCICALLASSEVKKRRCWWLAEDVVALYCYRYFWGAWVLAGLD